MNRTMREHIADASRLPARASNSRVRSGVRSLPFWVPGNRGSASAFQEDNQPDYGVRLAAGFQMLGAEDLDGDDEEEAN